MTVLSELRYACQTYSWQMSGDRFRGQLNHMIDQAADAGFTGFEAELVMLGQDWTAASLATSLQRRNLDLAGLVLVEDWQHRHETDREVAAADRVIEAASTIPASKIVLVAMPGPHRESLRQRQSETISCMTDVATRAADHGVGCTFHPNSPSGSLFRTAEDYDVMSQLLPDLIGYTPDLGHIAQAGMDPLTVVRDWRNRVDHVHVKDVAEDGSWAPTGTGVVDIHSILEFLAQTSFDGWVTFEDESPDAERDPDQATGQNGRYIAQLKARARL